MAFFVPIALCGALLASFEATSDGGAARSDELRLRLKAGDRLLVRDTTHYSDRITALDLRAGDEVLYHLEPAKGEAPPAPAPLALGRRIEIEREFADAIQQVGPEGRRISSLDRTYHRQKCTLETEERGTSRGPRRHEIIGPLQGRTLTVSRASGAQEIGAVLKPRPRNPQQAEPPADPPAEDLRLSLLAAHLEQALPAGPTKAGESWKLTPEAIRAFVGGLDGFPFPRAEKLSAGMGEGARSRDPVAVFIARGACEATARLEEVVGGEARVAISIRLELKDVDPYIVSKDEKAGDDSDQPDKPDKSAEDAGGPSPQNSQEALESYRWSGSIQCAGSLIYSTSQGIITSADLKGDVELSIHGRGPAGPARVELEVGLSGQLERSTRIRRVRS